MLAVEISRHGGPDVLVPVDRADPVPPRGEVLVCNRWVGVNYVDLQHREGRPYPVTLPLVPGTEAAGTIVAVGPGVDAGLVGTPVVHFGHLAGVYAELTAVPLDYVVPLPPDTPLDVAAAVALSGTTAYVLTSAAHRVGPGDVVVVHAAAGATGGAVVQRAAAAGADVIAIASTAEKAAAAATLGAGHAIALRETPDPVAAVMSASGGQGADVVYDATGRDTFEASWPCSPPAGPWCCTASQVARSARSTPAGCQASPATAVPRVPLPCAGSRPATTSAALTSGPEPSPPCSTR